MKNKESGFNLSDSVEKIRKSKRRKEEMEMFRLSAKDEAFYQAFFDTMKKMVDIRK